jgi:predicted amidophosphoribosyltransferase
MTSRAAAPERPLPFAAAPERPLPFVAVLERPSPFVAALGWALPLSCVGCQTPDQPLCASCLDRARASAPPPHALRDGTTVFAGSSYADEARRAIVALKTEGFTAVDKRLAVLLDAALTAACAAIADAPPPARDSTFRDSTFRDSTFRDSTFRDSTSHGSTSGGVASNGTVSNGSASHGTASHGAASDGRASDGRASHDTGVLAAVRERDGLATRRRPVLFVPVPSSRRGFRARGYRPVDRVLGRTGRRATPALAYARQPSDQIGLDAEQRAANMRGSMRVTRRVTGRTVILIDDVCTTGATLTEAADVLRAAGARRVCAAVIAATPLRSLMAQTRRAVSDFSNQGDYGGAKGVEEPPELSGGTPYRGGRYGN